MNRFNKLLLGTTALTLVTVGSAAAAPFVFTETTDFALSSTGIPTALSIAVASGGSSGPFAGVEVYGSVGGAIAGDASGATSSGGTTVADDFDVFSVAGLTPGQLLRIQLVPTAVGSGGIASSSGGASTSSFALNLMEYVGGSGSGGGDASSSGTASSSGSTTPTLTQIGPSTFQSAFDFDAYVPTAGELIFQIESGLASTQGYRLVLSAVEDQIAVTEPGSAAGLAAGAAGLGFLAARRRRCRT